MGIHITFVIVYDIHTIKQEVKTHHERYYKPIKSS